MKTARQSIVKSYAKAFLTCYSSVLLPEDMGPLSACIDVIKKHKQTLLYLCQGAVSVEEKITFLSEILTKIAPHMRTALQESLVKLLTVLVYHERIDFLFDIMFLIRIRFFNTIGYQHAYITTSHPVNDEEKKDISESFKDITHKNIHAEYAIDPRLIAGIRIVSQDYMWEYSIAQKIKALHMH